MLARALLRNPLTQWSGDRGWLEAFDERWKCQTPRQSIPKRQAPRGVGQAPRTWNPLPIARARTVRGGSVASDCINVCGTKHELVPRCSICLISVGPKDGEHSRIAVRVSRNRPPAAAKTP